MSLEDRIRHSLDTILGDLRDRLDAELQTALQAVVLAAAEEREEAVARARAEAHEGVDGETARAVADAEARLRADFEAQLAEARADERERVAAEIRRIVEAQAEQRIREAVEAANHRVQLVVADADARADETARTSIAAAHVTERETELADLSRLLDSVRGLDGATSLSEVLDALAQAAGREAGRAAVVVLRGDRVQGWRLSGFGPRDGSPRAIDMPLNEAGVIGLAVGAARAVTTRDTERASEGPGFTSLPEDRMGLAVPVIVGGRVVAIVYADSLSADGEEPPVPSAWPEAVEVLARHAARCLEALTAQRAAAAPSPRFWVPPGGNAGRAPANGDPPADAAPPPTAPPADEAAEGPEAAARRFARLLLSEIRMYNEPAVDEARKGRDLLVRLGPEIERARRLYDERVPDTLPTRSQVFHEELVQTLAGGDSSVLGVPA